MPTESPKRWVFKHTDEVLIARQAEQLNISPFLARLLVLRGLADAESAKTYLSSSLRSDLPSPFAMAGMATAVERIVSAVKNKELIGIWGDYDVDGTTGAAVLVSFLREIGAEPVCHVPHRVEEGYGLNVE
jgi:single-stranded-DNA-specific exonuclease